MNTFFNFANFVSKGNDFRSGKWEIKIKKDNDLYIWEFESERIEQGQIIIKKEILKKVLENNESINLVVRNNDTFKFMDESLPKLSKEIPSVNILKEEEIIKPLYHVFSLLMRRRFHDDDLKFSSEIFPLSKKIIESFNKNNELLQLYSGNYPVQAKLYIMSQSFQDKYSVAIEYYKNIFPYIEDIKFELAESSAIIPIFFIKEKSVKKWIPFAELSSGMQKVLLIITDILCLPGECTYIIDEYENSLGINAIDFLPQFLIEFGGDNQFLITTHHPYLINNFPVEDWLIFNRKGSNVKIKKGIEYKEKFGKSKQTLFTQLVNDSFYNEINK